VNNHLNIKFHILPCPSHPLIGSRYDTPWNIAQSRYFAAIQDLFRREPHKKFYFFCDDDTFLYPGSIPLFLHDKDPTVSSIYGRLYQPWIEAMVYYRAGTDQTVLAQGGAGFAMTAALRAELSPFIAKCQEIFLIGNMPSSNRLSLCIERYLGSDRAVNYGVYHHAEWIMNEDGPLASRPRWYPVTPIVSFHHIISPETEALWNAHVSVAKESSGKEKYWDWNAITLASFFVEIGEAGRMMEVIWGYMIFDCVTDFEAMENTTARERYRRAGNASRAVEAPQPVLAQGAAVAFVQRFEHGITLMYDCDAELPEDGIVFDRFLNGGEYGSAFRVHCPEPRRFLLEYPANRSPRSVSYEQE
jgi:hypothetical protein